MNVFKPKSLLLLLVLRMRQISVPLASLLGGYFFLLKSEFLHTHIILENHEVRRSLVKNGNQTSKCDPIE